MSPSMNVSGAPTCIASGGCQLGFHRDHTLRSWRSHLKPPSEKCSRVTAVMRHGRLLSGLRVNGLEVAEIGAEVPMTSLIRTICVAAFLLTSGSVVGAQTSVSIGINIGSPPPPPQVVYVAPPPPYGPGYVWVDGYWYPVEHKHKKHTYKWHDGYWTRPPYSGARWVAARYDRQMFFVGYWEGPRGRMDHDHRWDGDHDRDYRDDGPGRGRGRGQGRGKG